MGVRVRCVDCTHVEPTNLIAEGMPSWSCRQAAHLEGRAGIDPHTVLCTSGYGVATCTSSPTKSSTCNTLVREDLTAGGRRGIEIVIRRLGVALPDRATGRTAGSTPITHTAPLEKHPSRGPRSRN